MRGVITKRDIIENFGLIWREFGLRCLARCISAMLRGQSTTFLELALLAPVPGARCARSARLSSQPQATDFRGLA